MRFQINIDGNAVRYYEIGGKFFRNGEEITEDDFYEAYPDRLAFCSSIEEYIEDNQYFLSGDTLEELKKDLLDSGFWEEEVNALFSSAFCDAWNEMNS